MPQSKRFGEQLSSLVNVAAFSTRSRKKLSALILLALAAASVSTATYAVRLQIFVNGALAVDTTTLTTPQADLTGPSPTSSGTSATATNTVSISTGDYAGLKITGPTSATATAVLAGPTGVSLTMSSATGVTTKVNAQGIIKYNGPANGTIEIVASNKFILPPGVWNTQRTGSQDSRGGTRCSRTAVTSPFATSAFCALNHTYTATAAAPSCSFCRTFDASEQGNVYRPITGGQVPAAGVIVTLTSEVGFFNSNQNVEVRRELVGGSLGTSLLNPPSTSGGAPSVTLSTTNSSFYLTTVKAGPEVIPCEPSTTGFPSNSFQPPAISAGSTFSCADNERKISRLKFTGLQTNDIINMPTTSTDLGTPDPGTLANLIDAKLLIDVQPIGLVENTDPATNVANPLLPSFDANWNPTQTTGKRQVLVLNSYDPETGLPRIDACGDDLNIDNVTLSLAGSTPVHPTSTEQAFLDKKSPCIGRLFFFDYAAVNSTLPAPSLESCQANPTVTLIASGVTLQSRFFADLTVPTQKGGKPGPTEYVPPPGCAVTNSTTGEVTCTTEVDAGATSVVTCCTSCGN